MFKNRFIDSLRGIGDRAGALRLCSGKPGEIQWIANGSIILESAEKTPDGMTVSTIRLAEHSDDITCYVRFQLLGSGGICLSQPFTCDDGDMARFIIEDDRTPLEKFVDRLLQILKSARIYIAFQELYRAIF